MELPDYMLLLILETLSFADLCRARVVSKHWHRLISSHEALCCEAWLHVRTDVHEEVWCPRTDKRFLLELKNEQGQALQPLASSHGLLLCRVMGSDVIKLKVGNPWTKKWKELPALPVPIERIYLYDRRSFHLQVDILNGNYKVTILPTNDWLPKSTRSPDSFSFPLVLQFLSTSGAWSAHKGLSDDNYKRKLATPLNKDCLIVNIHIAYDSERLLWAWIDRGWKILNVMKEIRITVQKSMLAKLWNWMLSVCTCNHIVYNTEVEKKLYIREIHIWLYGSTRLMGAGVVTSSDLVIGFAVVEFKEREWAVVSFATFDQVYGNRQAPKLKDMPRFVVHSEGDTVFWSISRYNQYHGITNADNFKLPPATYDLAHSRWMYMDFEKSPIYSHAITFSLLSP